MRSPAADGTSVPTAAPNAFSPTFLEQLHEEEEPLTAAEADLAGPWKVEPLPPEDGQPGAFAVLRFWESVTKGDLPEAVFVHGETAALFAALLIEREALFALEEEPTTDGPLPGGYPVTAMYGEQGIVVRGWLRRYRPETTAALHLLEGLVRAPLQLAAIAEAAGGGAIQQLGRLLHELLAARRRGGALGDGVGPSGEPGLSQV
jgi:hypothetical protein